MCPKLVSEGSHKAPHLPSWFESSHPDKNLYKDLLVWHSFCILIEQQQFIDKSDRCNQPGKKYAAVL